MVRAFATAYLYGGRDGARPGRDADGPPDAGARCGAAARGAARCYQSASETTDGGPAENRDRPLSISGFWASQYREAGNLNRAAFEQFQAAGKAYTQGNSAHARLLKLHASAMSSAAESQRIRITISCFGMSADQSGDTVYFFDMIESKYQEAGEIYKGVLELHAQLEVAQQAGNTDREETLRQQIDANVVRAEVLMQQTNQSLHQLLSDPNRVSDQVLRQLGYPRN